jgi:hypothetical protein
VSGEGETREAGGAPAGSAIPLDRVRALLFAFAIALRLVYAIESTALPFMEAPLFDSAVYLRQAEAIRAHDFGDATLVAFSPLYGWFLACAGGWAIGAQLVLGLLTALLVERIAAHHSKEAGVAALALWIGYALPLFYETKVMSETLGLFLLAAALLLIEVPKTRRAFVGGAVLGLAVLARANLLFALPFFVGAELLPRTPGESGRSRVVRAGTLALGAALVLAGNGAWNMLHVGRFIPVILVSRTASVAARHGEWRGSLAIFGAPDRPPSAWDVVDQAEIALGRRPAPEPAAEAPVPSGIDLGGWLRSAPAKLARTFSDVETTFDYAFYGERSELRALQWHPLSFGSLLVLGLAGAIVLARRRGAAEVLRRLPLVVCVIAVTTLFHPSSRYRLPMALPLVLWAATGLVELARAPQPARSKQIAGAGLALVCALLALRHWTYPLRDPAMWQVRVAEAEALRGDVDAARGRLRRAYELTAGDPGSPARQRIELLRRHGVLPPPPPP